MKKYLLLSYIVMFILLLVNVYGESEVLTYSGWVYSGESVYAKNQVFIINVEMYMRKIHVEYEDGELFIDNGDCEVTKLVKICVIETDYDTKEDRRRAELNIYSIIPDIEIERTVDKSSLFIGEEAEFTVTITNNGGVTAKDVTFEDAFSDAVIFTDVDGVIVEGDSVKWSDDLLPGEFREISYTIKAVKDFSRTLKAKVTYFDGLYDKEIYSSAISIIVDPFFKISGDISKDEIYIGYTTNLTVTLENKDEEDITVNYLDIVIPSGLVYEGVSSIRKMVNETGYKDYGKDIELTKINDTIYRWSGVLENKTDKFRIHLRGKLKGSPNIIISAEYTDDEGVIRKRPSLLKSVRVKNKEIEIRTNFEDTEKIETLQQKELLVWIQNVNPYVKLKNINIETETDVDDVPEMFIDTLDYGENKKIINTILNTPFLESNKNFLLKIKVHYESEYGDKFYEEEEKTIAVHSIKPLEIIQRLQKTTIEEDEETEIKITVKNDRLIDIYDIYVFDTSSDELEKKGITSRTTKVNKENSKDVYTYIIKAPKVKNITKYDINTTIEYSDHLDSYVYSDGIQLLVEPKKVKLTISKKKTDSEIFEGEFVNIDYVIKNPSSQTVTDIEIRFPTQQEFDLIGGKSFKIDQLDPGETYNLFGKEQVRPKFNETQKLEKTKMYYTDKHGNRLHVNSSILSLNIKSNFISGPAVIVNKTLSRYNVSMNERFKVFIDVENIGDIGSHVILEDLGNRWELNVGPHSKKTVSYITSVDSPGEITLDGANATYFYSDKVLLTRSNMEMIDVINKTVIVNETVEKDDPEIIIIEEEIYENESGMVPIISEDVSKSSVKKIIYSILFIVLIIVGVIIFLNVKNYLAMKDIIKGKK